MRLTELVAEIAGDQLELARSLMITGGPARVELRRGEQIHATWIAGAATITDDLTEDWEITATGEPVQFGVQLQGIGIRWGEPVDPAVATGVVEVLEEPPPKPKPKPKPKPARRRK